VDHVLADAILALTATERAGEAVREALGDRVGFIQYVPLGLALARLVAELAPDCEAIVLAGHGLLAWAGTAEECFQSTISVVERAQSYLQQASERRTVHPIPRPVMTRADRDVKTLLLKLRGRLGHVILRCEDGAEHLALSSRPDIGDLALAGPATPAHVSLVGPWFCVLDADDPTAAIDAYEDRHRHRRLDSQTASADPVAIDPHPRVFVIPGIGLVAAGANAREVSLTAEAARHDLRVAALAKDAYGSLLPLPVMDLLAVERKAVKLEAAVSAPAPKELAGRVIAVTGAASGIGRAVARHLAGLGAQLALLDVNEDGLQRTASLMSEDGGDEPLCIGVDLTDESAVRAAVARVVRSLGGVDGLVSNAGIPATGALTSLDPALWRRSMDVNATSHFLMTAEVMKAMTVAGLGGSIVYVASKNAFGPGAGFGAYSAAKAAQVQLARIAALEGGASGIRANVVNPDAVFENSGLWSEGVRRERAAAHGVPVEELEQFYARRNLLKTTISGRDVAEAVAFLVSDRSRATTGTVIAVDGGVPAAFPR
jgi:NAD(P)-dependent dehydrogenase (short-subunit alcohol dehydrogenase family)